jgi:hypothetical protein
VVRGTSAKPTSMRLCRVAAWSFVTTASVAITAQLWSARFGRRAWAYQKSERDHPAVAALQAKALACSSRFRPGREGTAIDAVEGALARNFDRSWRSRL